MRKAVSVGRDQLLSLGICFGKFSGSGKQFKLHITALEIIAKYAPVIRISHFDLLVQSMGKAQW